MHRAVVARVVAGPAAAGEPRERAAVDRDAHGRGRRDVVEQQRAPFGRNVTAATIGGEPATSNTTVASRRRARLLPHDVGQALGRMRSSDRSATGPSRIAGPVERFADVLVVVPAVEDADRHELPVRAGPLGREALTVPVVGGQRAQRCEPRFGDRRGTRRALRCRAARGSPRSTARSPCRCRCARARAPSTGGASGCSPSSIRSVPIMCATLSLTDQPGHSVGQLPLLVGEIPRTAR